MQRWKGDHDAHKEIFEDKGHGGFPSFEQSILTFNS